MIHGPLSMKESTMTVDDIVTSNGIWDLGKLSFELPEKIINLINCTYIS